MINPTRYSGSIQVELSGIVMATNEIGVLANGLFELEGGEEARRERIKGRGRKGSEALYREANMEK